MQATLDLSERIGLITVSSTMKVAADADRLRREGVDVVDFGAGEPDFPTPDNIKQAAIRAISENFTKYTPAGGTQELKQAICERHAQDFGTSYTPAESVVSVGGKHIFLEFAGFSCDVAQYLFHFIIGNGAIGHEYAGAGDINIA